MITIVQTTSEADIQHVIELAGEYVTWMVHTLKATYSEIDTELFLQAHAYENLQARFPGEYIPPDGGLFIAYHDDQACGCIALARWTDTICEMQTLFVREMCRGQGIGKALVVHTIAEAKKMGYQAMRLDTLAFMISAQTLYQSLGFVPIEPYRDGAGDIQQYIRFYELALSENA